VHLLFSTQVPLSTYLPHDNHFPTLATVDCSPPGPLAQPRSIELQQRGALLEIVIRSLLGSEERVTALIDTGSQYTAIDDALAGQLQLVQIDRWPIGGVGTGTPQYVAVFQAEIEIPTLGIREITSVLGGLASDPKQRAILGRTQLRDCYLAYDGTRGTVTLSR
jgi:predicted aspartyl protease